MKRKLAGETWIIPEHCRKRLVEMQNDLEKPQEDYFLYLDHCCSVVTKATNELRNMVRADMGVK